MMEERAACRFGASERRRGALARLRRLCAAKLPPLAQQGGERPVCGR